MTGDFTKFIKRGVVFFTIFAFLTILLMSVLKIPILHLYSKGGGGPGTWWYEFYGLPQNSIDMIFLGSSHSYASFNPKLFEENGHVRAFNMSSGSQTSLVSYFVLQEALKTQHPRMVVLETYWDTIFTDQNNEEAAYHTFPYMHFGLNKIDFFLALNSYDQLIYLVYPSQQLYDGIIALIKLSAGNFKHFVSYKGYVEAGGLTWMPWNDDSSHYSVFKIDEKSNSLAYVFKIIQLCRQENIQLIFVTAPVRQDWVENLQNYQQIHDHTAAIAQQYNIPYIDYILINKEKALVTSDDFIDDGHLNGQGADIISLDLNKRLRNLGFYNAK